MDRNAHHVTDRDDRGVIATLLPQLQARVHEVG